MRLKLEIKSALKKFVGKRPILFDDHPRGICSVFDFAGKVRMLNIQLGTRSRTYFGFDLGTFSDGERFQMAQSHIENRLEGALGLSYGKVEIIFPQIVPAGTASRVVPALLRNHDDDLRALDEIIAAIRSAQFEAGEPRRIFAESPDPAYMRPPGIPLN